MPQDKDEKPYIEQLKEKYPDIYMAIKNGETKLPEATIGSNYNDNPERLKDIIELLKPKNCIEKFAKENGGLLLIVAVLASIIAIIETYWIFIIPTR